MGTYIEIRKIREVSTKLGQYMYVLKCQSYPEIQQQPQQVMKTFSLAIEQILTEFDSKLNQLISKICHRIL